MEKIKNFLTIEDKIISKKHLLLLMLIAYVFSIAVRFIWVYEFKDVAEYHWNNELMINTNDGYWWAEGTRDILKGSHEPNDYSSVTYPISKLTAFFVKILPFSFETIILYIPAFLGSLLVIPIILIGYSIKKPYMGFVAGLIGGIVWSYYNRTMVGYYDTDMLVIVFPTIVLSGIIFALTHNRNRWLLIMTFSIIMYSWWYGGAYSLLLAMAFMLFIYTFVFERKRLFNYKLLIFILIAMLPALILELKLFLSFFLFFIFHYEEHRVDRFNKIYDFMKKFNITTEKLVFIIFILVIILVLFSGGFSGIISKLNDYVFRSAIAGDITLHYFNVVQTVREAGHIPFEIFANRISGHPIIFFLSTIGYFLLAFRYKILLLALPMLGLGFLAMQGGLRFTVYAVPINALGIAYLIFLFAKYFQNAFAHNIKFIAKYIFVILATLAVLYPNIIHIQNYKVPVVFDKNEVTILDKLKDVAGREDYVVTWWDYGYPIRYYSDVKTLIDGAKHSGFQNYPVSFILSHPNQTAAANMARLDVEYTELNFKDGKGSTMDRALQDYGLKNPNELIKAISSKDFKLPEKTRDVYIYLPFRMLNIFPTVNLFSNLDLLSGQTYPNPFFYFARNFQDKGNEIHLGSGIKVFKEGGAIQIGNQKIVLNSFITVGYNKDGRLQRHVQSLDPNSPISVIFMQTYKAFLVLDQNMLNSLFIQLFVLEEFDSELFEPSIMSPLVKVYKLKK